MTLLVSLLLVTVGLAALLAYEAHQAARSHRVTIERALRDYASVAAWEFVAKSRERLDGEVLRALGPLTSGNAPSPYEMLASPAVLAATAGDALRCAPPDDVPRLYFRLDLRTGVVASTDTAWTDGTLTWLRDTITTHARTQYQPAARYASIYPARADRPAAVFYSIKYAQHGAPIAAYGFTTCGRAFAVPIFRRVVAESALLPSTVSGGIPNDSLVAIAVLDSAGATVFRSRSSSDDSSFAGEAALAGFGGLSARAHLVSTAAERLLVGRPLRSRLPLLVGLLVLTVALAAIALLQLRREHDLARLRADFTSGVSHELRTPLSQILLYGETLSLGRARSEADRRLAADAIVQEARRLVYMVDNILHFSRARQGGVDLDRVAAPLGPLVESVVSAFRPLADESGTRLITRIDEGLVAEVDSCAMRQILLNLLDNAVKYGAPGDVVTVTLSATDARARLAVEDEGRGIPADDRERIWAPYVRLRRDRTAARVGSGIGLSVVRDLTALHGGRAWVEEGDGAGARFVVELPLVPA